jgi:thioredoxin reductase (NADPH)
MAQQVLLVVDGDREILTTAERDLSRRFAADYRIVTADTPEAAFAELDIGDQVALVMAGQSLADTDGVDFLNTCHQLHPAAKRSCSLRTEISPLAAQACGQWRSDFSMTT